MPSRSSVQLGRHQNPWRSRCAAAALSSSKQPFWGSSAVNRCSTNSATSGVRSWIISRESAHEAQKAAGAQRQIGDRRNCVPQSPLLRDPFVHLRCSVLIATDWSPQHGDAFWLPHLLSDLCNVVWLDTCLDARDPHHGFFQHLVQRFNAFWFAEQVHIVEKRTQLLAIYQMCCHFFQYALDANGKQEWH